ncbi:MAG TPA: glycosyl hydrolase 115 family protein, partial [Magnetospirillaceae bacterium]|nr:glycosyl hydrolase 115 family protein [Magnetospirillaceae bacterium]
MKSILLIGLFALFASLPAPAGAVELFDGSQLAPILHQEGPTAALAAGLLARDLHSLTGRDAVLSSDLAQCGTLCIIIGEKDSPLVTAAAREAGADLSALDGQWERYRRAVLHGQGRTYLLIAGSDLRGMVWGVVDLSREMGVSAWEWWADVAPRKVARLAVKDVDILSKTPSVRYRGLFLNDEDWGLEPWAAKTYDPATGNIGPRTYSRIFELMWRLKANAIWPAMHSVSSPFFGDPANPRLAGDYAIVVGTSHAEPMMRNNLREWDEKARGPFNFLSNRDAMADYWLRRVEES